MAKLTNETFNKIKYVSLNDYYKNVDKFESLDDKMKYTTRYLLSHKGREDYNLQEAVQFARQVIAKELVKEENANNLRANMFVSKPIEYLQAEGEKILNEFENSDIVIKNEELKATATNIAHYLNTNLAKGQVDSLNNDNAFNLRIRSAVRMGGRREFVNNYNETKPGFFSRIFNTTSNEWKNLDNAYKQFNNPDSPIYGDKDALKSAAMAYMAHKVPGYEENQLLTDDYINALGKTGSARTMFALNIIGAVNEQKIADRNMEAALESANAQNVTYDQIEHAKPKVINLDDSFQNQLQKDLEEDLDKSQEVEIENNDIQMENEKELNME